ncbi:MAG: MerR family DNA-binding transcriptional regulator [Vicinamibacterales bacterium]
MATLTGVSVDALRYYERIGLLKAPPRTQGGLRRYPSDVVQRVGFIKQAQSLGLALEDIQELQPLRLPSRARPVAEASHGDRRTDEGAR